MALYLNVPAVAKCPGLLPYTGYTKFNGGKGGYDDVATRSPHDNNTELADQRGAIADSTPPMDSLRVERGPPRQVKRLAWWNAPIRRSLSAETV